MKRIQFCFLHRKKIFFLCICIVFALLLPITAAAADVTYSIDGVEDTKPTLGEAIGAINSATQGGAVIITLPQAVSQKPPSTGPAWVMKDIRHTNVLLNGNGASIVPDNASAFKDRLLVLSNIEAAAIRGLTFAGGNLINSDPAMPAASDQTSGGGGLFIGADDDGLSQTAAANIKSLGMGNLTFTGNSVTMHGYGGSTDNNGYAVGGGLSVQNVPTGDLSNDSEASLRDLRFTGNAANFFASAASNGNAQGGGARIFGIRRLTMTNSYFGNNTALVANGSHAVGGGLAVLGTGAGVETGSGATVGGMVGTLSGLTFENNLAHITGKGDTRVSVSYARGGGLYLSDSTEDNKSAVTVADSVFTGNTAWAETGGNQALGGGGAVWNYAGGTEPTGLTNVTFTNSEFSNNAAKGSGGAEGYGGALYLKGSHSDGHVVSGSRIVNNHATTAGGGIYVSTDFGATGTTALTVSAVAGGPDTLIQGNTAGEGAGKHASGIAFGGQGDGKLTIGGTGAVWLIDPIKVEMGGSGKFVMDVTNTGGFHWNGDNIFKAATSTITLGDSSVTNLGRYFTATAEGGKQMDLRFGHAATMNVDINRAADLPLFNYVGKDGTAGLGDMKLNTGGSLHIGVTDMDRQLMDKGGRILLVQAKDDATAKQIIDGLNGKKEVTFDTAHLGGTGAPTIDRGGVYLDYTFKSDHQAAITKYKNAAAALPQLHEAVQREYGITDQQYEAIKGNWASVTPNYGPAQA